MAILKKRISCNCCHCKMEVGTEIVWEQTLRARPSRKYGMITGQVFVPAHADKNLCDKYRAEYLAGKR